MLVFAFIIDFLRALQQCPIRLMPFNNKMNRNCKCFFGIFQKKCWRKIHMISLTMFSTVFSKKKALEGRISFLQLAETVILAVGKWESDCLDYFFNETDKKKTQLKFSASEGQLIALSFKKQREAASVSILNFLALSQAQCYLPEFFRSLIAGFRDVCKTFLLSWISVRIGSVRHLLQDEDPSGSGLHSFPDFFLFEYRDISRTGPKWTRACGFRRNSSSLDRAPKMRPFVLLNSWDSFLVILPLIASGISVM